ncbi:type II secretion system minor pseudopilin GspI [Escherichia coli]|nr:type II secretion system minor pseudopilin GspI [Escherichia coli]EET5015864.1 type II secretion system minor pseudopilin GspI [Escherichia coli]EKY4585200.1 type II secretion system minor pseudopilin GspI [Escherichia coli]HEB3891216.1 type II secretion system minor pseudopilin GspI [Escherichia coli]
MTLLEVMVALVVFALAGIALIQSTTQQAAGIGPMEEKVLAGWLADNQMVQLQLEKIWPKNGWDEKTISFAGREWYLRWHGRDSDIPEQRILEVEVEVRRTREETSALVSLRGSVVRE